MNKTNFSSLIFALVFLFTSMQLRAQVTNGLVGYWSFDDSTAKDNSGHGHDGTIFGNPSSSAGIKGSSFYFNGSAQDIQIPNSPELNFGTQKSMSISIWIKIDSNDYDRTNVRTVIGKRIGGSDNSDYIIFSNGGKIYWGTGDASDSGGAWLNIHDPSLGAWHHFATTLRYNASTNDYYKKFYVDGKIVREERAYIKSDSVNEPLYIAYANEGGIATYFYGNIDEVRIYNRELSDCDVQALYKFGNVLQGTASTSTGAALANSKISLIVYNPADTTLTEVSSTYSDSKGNYCLTAFDSVVYIYAAPDSANYPHEMPAYGDSFIDFSGATPTHISNGHNTANVKTLSGSNPGGSGFIGGKIVYCTICKKAGSGTPAQGLKVILADSMGHPQAITYTDAKGNFSFQNIALTKYTILVDRPNVDNNNAPKVQLTADLTLRANLNFTLYPTYLALDVTSGIEENNAFSKSIEIFPNPANQYINIHNGAGQKIESIHIFNMLGETVRLNNVNSSSENIQINLNDLKSGIYLLEVRSANGWLKRQSIIIN